MTPISIRRWRVTLQPTWWLTLLFVTPTAASAQSLEFGPPYTLTGGFTNPFGVAVNRAQQHLLVADTRNRRVRWTSLSALTGTPAFQTFGFVANTSQADALLDPEGIAADDAGHVYVVDARQNEVKLYTWNATTSTYDYDAAFASATRHIVAGVGIESPRDVAVGPGGKVYLLDSGRKRILRADGPADPSWDVFLTDATLSNPYGLDVGPDGRIYVADTDHHRIVRYTVAGVFDAEFGRHGTGPVQFRYPRDVAVDINARMYVADTHNYRVQIVDQNGAYVVSLGRGAGFGTAQKLALDEDRHVFIADADRDAVIAFLGKDAPVPFDGWLRDYVGDAGAQPSDPAYTLASPDILLRHAADADTAAARVSGLESIGFQQPRYDTDNFVYVAVRNRGTQSLQGAVAKVYWAEPAGALAFPTDWKDTGFLLGESGATAGDALVLPPIAPGGVQIVGPLRWRPPAPELASAGQGAFMIGVRIVQPFDVPPNASGLTAVRASNNVAVRRVIVSRGPFATGDQNTLVVSVGYSDDPTVVSPTTIAARVASLAAWTSEVSWGTATVKPLTRGQITLPQPRAYYASPSRSRLVEMTKDALDILLQTEPDLLDGVLPSPSDDIARVILVTNDVAPDVDWATTGPWPYHLATGDRYLTVSVQGMLNTAAAFEHGMSHQFGLLDLFLYPNVSIPRAFAEGWDNMAKPFSGVHPTVWSKKLATWVSEKKANIVYVPRPAKGASYSTGTTPLPLYYQSKAQINQPIGIAIGLTPGAGTLEDETTFYYLEARSSALGDADVALPGSGVLMYYVNEQIPQGQGPVIVSDFGASTNTLVDAAIPVGGTHSPSGTGISVSVGAGNTTGPAFNITLGYTPPLTGYDASIKTGTPPWTSPDIWIDNQADGFDVESGRAPTPGGDKAVGGEENRIYALVHNAGPADAVDVEVAFFISEPWHTVGGKDDFTYLKSVIIRTLQPGDKAVYITWIPSVKDPHTCVRVVLRHLLNDINAANNEAQQNIEVAWSTTKSPFKPVAFTFQVTNPDPTPKLVYFRADQVPVGWTHQFTPERVQLGAKQKFTGSVIVSPPPTANNCTSHDVYVTAWTPEGHTLVRLGGTTVTVNLAKEAGLTSNTRLLPCSDQNYQEAERRQRIELARQTRARDSTLRVRTADVSADSAVVMRSAASQDSATLLSTNAQPCLDSQCLVLETKGCTDPVQPNAEVIVRYLAPDGTPVYRTVKTQSNGCFEDFFAAVTGGKWDVTAAIAGSACLSPVAVTQVVRVGLPVGAIGDSLPAVSFARAARVTPLNYRVRGKLTARERFSRRCVDCRSRRAEHELRASLGPIAGAAAGDLVAPALLTAFADATSRNGVHVGAATIRTLDGLVIEGVMRGVTNGTAHAFGSARRPTSFRLEGQFIGRVLEGRRRGCRLVLHYALELSADAAAGDASVAGLADGVWECACREAGTTAVSAVDSLPSGCVFPFSARGDGSIRLTTSRKDRCDAAAPVLLALQRAAAKLASGTLTAPAATSYANATLAVDSLVQLFAAGPASPALHGAPFGLVSSTGERVSGRVHGLTHVDPHRTATAMPSTPHHLEGIVRGVVESGRLVGCQLRGVYSVDYPPRATLHGSSLVWSIEGAIVCDCSRKDAARPSAQAPQTNDSSSRESNLANRQRALARDSALERLLGSAASLSASDRLLADVDHDGRTDPIEASNLRLARESFAAGDSDRGGTLSLAEFAAYGARTILPSLFDSLDANRDGTLDAAEGAGLPLAAQRAVPHDSAGGVSRDATAAWIRVGMVKQFEDLDRNRDGRLSFGEYFRGMPRLSTVRPRDARDTTGVAGSRRARPTP